MEKLFANLTPTQVILYAFLIFVSIKEVWTLVDFFIDKVKKKINKEKSEDKDEEKIISSLNTISNQMGELQTDFEEHKVNIKKALNSYQDQLDLLIESDRDDIKSDIVKQYHYFVENKKWIDDFSLDSIERRYKHYKDEGGNSYVKGLMEKIRQLPNQP
ncbi:MAG: hypothetical protein J6T34_01375 [Bacilli bacterium]|nr:hypothetical protein [Bacilli bacterium]